MSADNGIYILCTLDGYRVRVLSSASVQNYKMDVEKRRITQDPNIWIKNARSIWDTCTSFKTLDQAYIEARYIYDTREEKGLLTEYGICKICIPREFYLEDSLTKCHETDSEKVISSVIPSCDGCVFSDHACDKYSASADNGECINRENTSFSKKLAELIEHYNRESGTRMTPDELAIEVCSFIGTIKTIAKKVRND